MGKTIDDEFAEEAKRAEAEELARQESRKRGSGGFEDIKWTGFTDSPQTKLLRFLGKHPDLHYGTTIPSSNEFDAHVVNMSRIIGDNGKQMDLILPLYDRDPNHIMWRIIDRMNSVEWHKVPDPKDAKKVISTKVYTNESKYPEIFGIVNFSGLPPENKQRKFGLIGKGWKGREVLIANVIDRELAEWHKANQHSALLAKKITFKNNPDGSTTEFVEKGIPSYGLNSLLNGLRKTYGDWEKYDIGFTRSGTKDAPNTVCNAGRTPETLPEALQDLVVIGALTAEEAAYKQYAIGKIFKVTTYTKLWNRLHLTIERIDACLGTYYAEELKKLSETEKELSQEAATDEVEDETPVDVPDEAQDETQEAQATPEKKVVARTVKESVKESKPSDLPGWSKLSEGDKAQIVSVVAPKAGDTAWEIIFSDKASKRVGECPDCGTESPETFQSCPGCGASFSS